MKKWVGCFFLLSIAIGLFAKTTVLYHTSDTHGFFYPKNGQGGVAALAAVLQKEKHPYLLLDAGDFAEGTMETKTSKGIKAIQLMNRLGYHAATLGNHEFAYGEDAFRELIDNATFPILAANLVENSSGLIPASILPYKIFNVDSVRIAVIGLANANPTRRVSSYHFIDPLLALEQSLNQPDVRQAQVVVVLVHDSLADDRADFPFYVGEIGRKFADRVQVVLGGHAHKTFITQQGVLFEEVGAHLQQVGKITLQTEDTTGNLVSVSAQLIPLVLTQTGEESSVKAYADRLKEPGMDEVLGTATENLSLQQPEGPVRDGQVENWIADVARSYSGAAVFVHNSAGVRTALEKGPVTRRDLMDMFPFDDTIIEISVTGKFLTELVRTSLVPRNLLSYSGLTVSYRLDKKNRIKKMRILINGKKIKKNKIYRLATNSYLAKGGSEGKLFLSISPDQKKQVGKLTMRELLIQQLHQEPLRAPNTGRVRQQN